MWFQNRRAKWRKMTRLQWTYAQQQPQKTFHQEHLKLQQERPPSPALLQSPNWNSIRYLQLSLNMGLPWLPLPPYLSGELLRPRQGSRNRLWLSSLLITTFSFVFVLVVIKPKTRNVRYFNIGSRNEKYVPQKEKMKENFI